MLAGNAKGNAETEVVTLPRAALAVGLNPGMTEAQAKAHLNTTIRTAGWTLRQGCQPAEMRALASKINAWPDVVYSRHEMGAWEPPKVARVLPNAQQQSECDAVLGWLFWLDRNERRVVFAVMNGYGFRKMAEVVPFPCSKSNAKRIYDAAIHKILCRLRDPNA